eukprot:1139408-Pelagomonas_calceolata.AAC.2
MHAKAEELERQAAKTEALEDELRASKTHQMSLAQQQQQHKELKKQYSKLGSATHNLEEQEQQVQEQLEAAQYALECVSNDEGAMPEDDGDEDYRPTGERAKGVAYASFMRCSI